MTLRARILKKKAISLEIFSLAWNVQSRPSEFPPKKIGPWWVARLKFSVSFENFNPGGQSFFSVFGQWIAKGAGGKGPRQKTSKIVKKYQEVFRHFSTIFAQGKKSQKSSKSVNKFSDTFRQFLRGIIFPAFFGGARFGPLRAGWGEVFDEVSELVLLGHSEQKQLQHLVAQIARCNFGTPKKRKVHLKRCLW